MRPLYYLWYYLCLNWLEDWLRYGHIFWALSINLIIILKRILFNEKSSLKILQALLQGNQSVRIHVVVICISPCHTVNLFKSVNTVNIICKPTNNMLFMVLAVSTHVHFGLYIRIICVYAKTDCTPIKHLCLCKPKCMSAVCANQKCTRALWQSMMHMAAELTSCVYTCATCIDSYVIDLLCTCRLFSMYFQKRVESCSCYTRVQSNLNWTLPCVCL